MAGKKPKDRRKLAAYHEAGHAVVAVDQGITVHGISIVPDELRQGHIRVDTLLLDTLVPSFEYDKGARNRFTMERHVMVLLAGYAAVVRLDPSMKGSRRVVPGEGTDYRTAMTLVSYFTGRKKETEKYLQWLEARVEGMIATPWRWHQVKRLARELMAHDRLGAIQVRRVIEDAGREWVERRAERGKGKVER